MMTGSIACYKACGILSKLKQNGHQIKVVMSPSSLQFIGRATIEGLIGEAPVTDMYASGQNMDHIHLNRWADLVIVAPATANYINKIAYGLGDDLLTTLFLSHDFKKPFLIAPAMNTMMYLHPTTQASLQKLKEMKIEILETASGVLACGEVGYGRLLEPELIVQEIETRLLDHETTRTFNSEKMPTAKNIKVLITSGGTTEPIDDVRVITNSSTGQSAAKIADTLMESGIEVTYLHAENAKRPSHIGKRKSFKSFLDLQATLNEELRADHYDWIIHMAAVSDYSVIPTDGKISSTKEEITLKLKRNPKLIDQIKTLSPKSHLVGFKLTSTIDQKTIDEKVKSLFKTSHCDFVVQNDWNDIKNHRHQYVFYAQNEAPLALTSTDELSSALFQRIILKESL
ncbi:MAG: bifunctional phosphopantothenoylcysteine decarboxylase/phosphopantothenate--cysteine ligase CoaBC [Bdellovibrionaceae bacterium]|nr:bifunctional phosphopantothenoylcysteine decarboxylase/phosphopantothenate--cysteine ligase CoaBC [Bdellovibrio sp.]